jgi:DNA-binding transcriptional ArsR family regulator
MDSVFKALADSNRRLVLDCLFAKNGQTLQELCEHVSMTRQGLSCHLSVLESAGLIVTEFRGRQKNHFLNPVPIQLIAERWISKFAAEHVAAITALKRAIEGKSNVGS